ncbi:MAG: HD domain-containing phosphohydrolase [Thermoleophilaceae bacterium]
MASKSARSRPPAHGWSASISTTSSPASATSAPSTRISAEDAAYRIGDDEFAVVLKGERAWGGFRFCQRLRRRLDTHPDGLPSATLGVAEPASLEGSHTVIRHAALALHEARRAGREVLIYSEALEPTARESHRDLERRHLKTLTTSLARACDAKDSYTRSHCETVADWILHHHERLDGAGYPEGLRGEEVPVESRVILVADAFEAMTSDRPYRRGRSEQEAFVELERHAGTQFDPDCVDALRRALGARGRRASLRLASA